ncbi:A-kinase anchor protein 17A isoform X2 [Trichomycterus rosablanca]|uniref:A-kinase anchor protein 17A isoform X2 n=1 Tax=Trichomycterus rosablanca TaxID=2290929 RepID=UPI002F35D28D
MATIVHDSSEALPLCGEYNLYLKPIAKMTISVALPQLKMPGKSISNWEVMERLKSMVHPEQFSSLRIFKSTMDYIRFEGEAENKSAVKRLLSNLDGKCIKLSGFTDVLKVRAAETKTDFPTRHDWDSFFRDAKDMNETVPGERPDTIHLEGLPCKWFAQKESSSDKPSEEVVKAVFERFGKIRNVDIPMLDPYREEMTGKNFNTFSFGGHLNFEGYVQYEDHTGFVKAMGLLKGMKLMYKGEEGKAIACGIKITFDTTKHLSESSIKKRNQERLKLQELERQREEQKRKEKEDEERRKDEERRQRELEEEEKEKKKEEKLRRREQKLKEREDKKNQKKVKKQQEEEQKKLHLKIAMEERKLLLAQRNLESIRLTAELLSRAKSLKQKQLEQERAEHDRLQKEAAIRHQQEAELRRQQEAELQRVEGEKARALELQRKERELRDRLLENLLKKSVTQGAESTVEAQEGVEPKTEVAKDVVPNGVSTAVLRGLQDSESRNEAKKSSSREQNRGPKRSHSRSRNRRYQSNRSLSGSGSGQRRSRDRRYSHGRSMNTYRRSRTRSRSRRASSRERRSHSDRRHGRSNSLFNSHTHENHTEENSTHC